MTIRIATRRSPLALWQSCHVGDALAAASGRSYELVDLATYADTRLDVPISELGGKGAFSKEVQQVVLAGEADLAVHSAKDLQAVTPDGLVIAAFPARGDVRDSLVGRTLDQLEAGTSIATGSSRRRVQLNHVKPGLVFEPLRGNIATRLAKTPAGGAVVVASVALDRLDIRPDVVDHLDPDIMVPQVGQGALAVECREADQAMIELLAAIDHQPTRRQVETERAFLAELGGDCDLPAGANAVLSGDEIRLTGVLASPDEARLARVSAVGTAAGLVGTDVARTLRMRIG